MASITWSAGSDRAWSGRVGMISWLSWSSRSRRRAWFMQGSQTGRPYPSRAETGRWRRHTEQSCLWVRAQQAAHRMPPSGMCPWRGWRRPHPEHSGWMVVMLTAPAAIRARVKRRRMGGSLVGPAVNVSGWRARWAARRRSDCGLVTASASTVRISRSLSDPAHAAATVATISRWRSSSAWCRSFCLRQRSHHGRPSVVRPATRRCSPHSPQMALFLIASQLEQILARPRSGTVRPQSAQTPRLTSL